MQVIREDGTPDNSLVFVRRALETAADAFEVDVRCAPDGTLRLGHDAAAGAAPALAEVFAQLSETPGKKINCDLKEPGLEEAVCALARERGLAGRVILTGTADPERYAASPSLRETAELWINLEEIVPHVYENFLLRPGFPTQAAERALAVCRRFGLDTVNLHYRLAVPAFASPLEAAGLRLSVWTVDEEAELRRFLGGGVYALTTRKLRTALALAGR